VGLALLLAGILFGAVPAAAQNRVGASTPAMINTVGSSTDIGAGQRLGETVPQPSFVVATGVAADTATPLFRGVAQGHHADDEALAGNAWPGDVLGHSDGVLHAAGLTEESALTSWTTSRKIAEGFATNSGQSPGVILETTLEKQAGRVVPGPDNLGEFEVLLRGVVFGAKTTRIP
jgi:hypothetical protein